MLNRTSSLNNIKMPVLFLLVVMFTALVAPDFVRAQEETGSTSAARATINGGRNAFTPGDFVALPGPDGMLQEAERKAIRRYGWLHFRCRRLAHRPHPG